MCYSDKDMTKAKVGFITNAGENSGVGLRAHMIARGLKSLGLEVVEARLDGDSNVFLLDAKEQKRLKKWAGWLGKKSVNWVRLGRAARSDLGKLKPQLYDFTNQTLSFMAWKLKPAVVTVHDIIEVQEPQDKRAYWLNRYLYSGIKAAERVIAVSHFTAHAVMEKYGVADKKIEVIYNGAGDEFGPIDNFKNSVGYRSWRQELKVKDNEKVVLYVGSEHPRKNVAAAVRSLERVLKAGVPAVLVKVGDPGLSAGRAELIDEIHRLRLGEKVRFLSGVTAEHLNELYNLADVFIYPSRLEGFGLPPLQAFAAGTPVVCSNAASLPEVTGDNGQYGEKAALTCAPDDTEAMAKALISILMNEAVAEGLRAKGIERAAQFSWQKAAAATARAYERVI